MARSSYSSVALDRSSNAHTTLISRQHAITQSKYSDWIREVLKLAQELGFRSDSDVQTARKCFYTAWVINGRSQ